MQPVDSSASPAGTMCLDAKSQGALFHCLADDRPLTLRRLANAPGFTHSRICAHDMHSATANVAVGFCLVQSQHQKRKRQAGRAAVSDVRLSFRASCRSSSLIYMRETWRLLYRFDIVSCEARVICTLIHEPAPLPRELGRAPKKRCMDVKVLSPPQQLARSVVLARVSLQQRLQQSYTTSPVRLSRCRTIRPRRISRRGIQSLTALSPVDGDESIVIVGTLMSVRRSI